MYEYVKNHAQRAVAQIVSLVRGEPAGGIIFITGPLMSGKSMVAVGVANKLRDRELVVSVGQPAVD